MHARRSRSLPALVATLLLASCSCSPEPLPRIDAISPARGPIGGGTSVVLAGSAFPSDAIVLFDDVEASGVERLSSTALRVVTPPHPLGWADVKVVGGNGVASRDDAFFFANDPQITSLVPARGPSAGGTSIVVVGQGFVVGMTVTIGGVPATQVVVVSDTMITAVTPPGSLGGAPLVLRDPYDQTADATFTYDDASGTCTLVTETRHGASDADPRIELLYDTAIDAESCASLRYVTSEGLRDARVDCEVVGTTLTLRPRDAYGADALVVAPEASEAGVPCRPYASVLPVSSPSAIPADPASIPMAAQSLAVYGGYAIVANPLQRALQWYALDAVGSLGPVGALELRAFPSTLHVRGDRLFVGYGRDGVDAFAIDAATALSLVRTASFGTPGRVYDLSSFEAGGRTYLAVADGAEGGRLYDVTDPAGALVRGLFAPRTPDGTTPIVAVDVQDHLLAYADAVHVGLVDVSDALAPSPLYLSPQNVYQNVTLDGTRLFVSRGAYGVDLLDVTTPAAPVLADHADGGHGPCTINCIDVLRTMVVVDDHLYVAATAGELLEYSLPDPLSIELVGSRPTRRMGYDVYADAQRIVVVDDTGLAVFDPGSALGAPAAFRTTTNPGDASGLVVAGSQLYVAAGNAGLLTYALDPSFALLDADATTGSPSKVDVVSLDVAAGGTNLFVGDGRAGLDRFDRSIGTNPTLADHRPVYDKQTRIDAAGDLVVVCADNGGALILSAAGGTFTLLHTLGVAELPPFPLVESCQSVRLDGSLLHVGARGVLGTYDVSDPSAPALVGAVTFPSGDAVVAIRRVGDRLVVGTRVDDADSLDRAALGRVFVVDVSDPSAPDVVHVSPDLGGVADLLVHDARIYVSTSWRGVQVLADDATGGYPFLGTIRSLGAVSGLAAHDDVLFVGARTAGALRVPLRVRF